MSGHSHWSTIQRQKGAADAKRGQTFTKTAKAITIAAKLGNSGDPDANPRLRMAIETAKAVNMPKNNITRAIEKGIGGGKEALEEVTYEGFGPGKIAFFVEGVTDNKLRTNQEIKSIFERNGGTLGGLGTVAYMFTKKGELVIKGRGGSSEEEELELIDLGADDIETFKDIRKYLVYTDSTKVNEVGNKITQAGYEIESQQLVMKPITLQKIEDPALARRVAEFAEKLEGSDDVQKVYSNLDIPENLI